MCNVEMDFKSNGVILTGRTRKAKIRKDNKEILNHKILRHGLLKSHLSSAKMTTYELWESGNYLKLWLVGVFAKPEYQKGY